MVATATARCTIHLEEMSIHVEEAYLLFNCNFYGTLPSKVLGKCHGMKHLWPLGCKGEASIRLQVFFVGTSTTVLGWIAND